MAQRQTCKVCGFTTKDSQIMIDHRRKAKLIHRMIRTLGKYPDSISINGKEYLAIEVIDV